MLKIAIFSFRFAKDWWLAMASNADWRAAGEVSAVNVSTTAERLEERILDLTLSRFDWVRARRAMARFELEGSERTRAIPVPWSCQLWSPEQIRENEQCLDRRQ
jgi:hypothetical protein